MIRTEIIDDEEILNRTGSFETIMRDPDKYVVNELLTYLFHYMKKASRDTLVTCIYQFYHLEQIIAAKTCIYEQFPDLGLFPMRKRTTQKSELMAHCKNTVNAAQLSMVKNIMVKYCVCCQETK